MAPESLKRKLLAFDTRTRKLGPTKRRTSTAAKVKPASMAKRETKPSISRAASLPIPENNGPLEPKVEYSPNGLAKCRACKKKIQKQHKRFGIPEFSSRYDKEIYRYYHARCCPTTYKNMIPDALEQLKKQNRLIKDKDRIIAERQGLHDDLKRLRLIFANRLEVSFFLVFNNDVLKELVCKMPTTPEELLKINGIGPNKLKSFGDPILSLIKRYKQRAKKASASDRKPKIKSEKKSAQRARKKAPAPAPEVITIDLDDDSDDDNGDEEIVMGASLTCEELVNMKFAHAQQNGYMITVD